MTRAGERENGLMCAHCATPIIAGDEVALCQACGTAHHRQCWSSHDAACGSYACAPPRRAVIAADPLSWKISAHDLDRIIPAPPPPACSASAMASNAAANRLKQAPRTSRLAVASLIVALVGIPMFGLLTGGVAVVLASLALGTIHHTRQKGSGVAVAALMLGLLDMVAWIVFLAFMINRGSPGISQADLKFSPADLKNVSPHISQAMRANVFITSHHGFGVGVGSGVILFIADGQAKILTNRHVVDSNFDADTIPDLSRLDLLDVQMLGQPTIKGHVTWIAPDGIDLALVAVACQSSEAQAAKTQRTRPTLVGDPVFAIGNPQALGWSHTQGSISQFRSLSVGNRTIPIIQTSAAINPGNSGGGLYDDQGALVGVNTWTSDHRSSEGMSFSISIEAFTEIMPPDLNIDTSIKEPAKP